MPLDLGRYDETQANYSPDNRLTRPQRVALAASLRLRQGISGREALERVGAIQSQQQKLLDLRVQQTGGPVWEASMAGDPDRELTWQEWMSAARHLTPDPNKPLVP